MYRMLEARDWESPDWIIVPGGNLGNCSAFGKAFMELQAARPDQARSRAWRSSTPAAPTRSTSWSPRAGPELERRPIRPAKVARALRRHGRSHYHAHTIASAIEISRPVNLPKALRALDVMNGVVREVTDEEILEAPGHGRAATASAASRPAPPPSPGCSSCSMSRHHRPRRTASSASSPATS